MTTTLNAGLSDHPYNDDLLLDERSRAHARAEFPRIFHVLDNPELRAAFDPIDQTANQAKTRSQQSGVGAVILAVFSLMGASSEPLWRDLPGPWPALIAISAALLGLAAVLLAVFGVLHGRQKDRWLQHRLCTERFRQFHFQAFIWKLPEIARSCRQDDPRLEASFVEDRRRTLEGLAFWLTRNADAELSAILAPTGGSKLWLHDTQDSPPAVPPDFDAGQLFKAYRRLRFEEQLGYTEHKLRKARRVLALTRAPLRNQRKVLGGVWLLAFGALVALHLVLVIGHFAGWHDVHRPLAHVAVVWLALIALGARTLEEGFSLAREIERYEDYRAAVADALARFDRARTGEEKLRAMMDLERLSFEEMRTFLRTADESSFVL